MTSLLSWLKRRELDSQRRSFLEAYRKSLVRTANFFLFLLALLAISSLAAEHGFYLSAELVRVARRVNLIVLYGFAALALLKLLLAEHRVRYLLTRWFELSLVLLILVYLLLPGQVGALLHSLNPLLTPDALARIYLVITQVFVMVAFVPAALRYSKRIMASNIQPSSLIVLSFLFLIIGGTLLLLLPRATVAHSFSFVDALFTATSAVCVTGLIVVDTATYFTPFGHTILMILIQIGGLGIMTLTTFFAFIVGGGAQLKEYSTLQSLLGEDSLGRIKQTIIGIALFTFVIEGIGAAILYQVIDPSALVANGNRLFFSVFHSVSAFCNAGFTLTTENLAHSALRSSNGVLWTVMVLIVVGGIGYPVLMSLSSLLRIRMGKGSLRRLTVHTKLVLLMTLILIIGGMFGVYVLEQDRTLRDLSSQEQLSTSLFHSISSRTAGFNTIDISAFSLPTLLLLIFLMWIGASPGSTGGGVKTTSIALAILNIYAIASGRNKVEVFRKRVSDIAITKAFSTLLLSFFFINIAVFCLLLTEEASLERVLFEVVSAFSTVGLSTGITPHLSASGRVVITACMFVGRVGLLAFVIALTRRRIEARYDYTEENVLVT